ncbi:MAG: head GIN domain-containing protein [Pseudomonadota bacterium]
MIRNLSLTALAGLVLVACQSTQNVASAEERDYKVGGFTAVDAAAGLDVNITTGRSHSVTVSNPKGEFDDITIEVRGNTLVLKRPQRSWGSSWNRRKPYQVTVTAPQIDTIEASSGSDVTAEGLSGDRVRLKVSSGADLTVTAIDAKRVSLSSSSGSDLSASGRCTAVDADSSSGSDIEARGLKCATGEADASSGSDITLHVTKALKADVSSGADVIVYGGPSETYIDKSSGGEVRVRG